MLRYFLPTDYVSRVAQVTPQFLQTRGYKAVLTDLDNTLIAWDEPYATEEIRHWFQSLAAANIPVIIVSNNNERRVREFCEPLGIRFVHAARKPANIGFTRALKQLNVKKEEVVMIGDQLMTDIFGANLFQLSSILVVPVAKTDGWITRFNRMMERKIVNRLKAKNLFPKEERSID